MQLCAAARLRGPAVPPRWTWRPRVLATTTALVAAVVALVAQTLPASGTVRHAAGDAADRRRARRSTRSYFEPGACVEYPPDRRRPAPHRLPRCRSRRHRPRRRRARPTAGQTDLRGGRDAARRARHHGAAAGQGIHRGGVADEGRDGDPPGPDDVSGGLFTVQGVHDDVAARDVCANMAKANVLVGIYFDAGGSPTTPAASRATTPTAPSRPQNLRLATLVQNDVLNAMNAQGWGIPNLGVVDDSELGGPALTDRGRRTTATSCCSARPSPAGSRRRARCRARSSSRSSSPTPSRGPSPPARRASRSSPAVWPRRSSSTSATGDHGPELGGRPSPPRHKDRAEPAQPERAALRPGPARSRPSAGRPRSRRPPARWRT